jgi:transcriptional regulator with XRE-family HTH domain
MAQTTSDINSDIDTDALAKAIFEKRSGGNRRTPEKALREIAAIIGVSAPTLSRIERGAMPDLATYVKICEWLKVPLEKFVKR